MVSTLVNEQRNVLDNEEIREVSTAFPMAELAPSPALNFFKQEFRGEYHMLVFQCLSLLWNNDEWNLKPNF